MSTSARYINGVLTFEDQALAGEQPFNLMPIVFEEDFIGAGHTAGVPTAATLGYAWIKKLVKTGGTPAVAIDGSVANATMTASIDATSEKQEALLYAADQRNWTLGQGLVFECRAKFPVLPTGVAKIVMGVTAAWADDPDTITNSAYFEALAADNGLVKCRVADAAGATTIASSGITLGTTDFHIFRIEFKDLTSIAFFIDGNPVATGTKFPFTGAAAAQLMQPFFDVYKASGVGLGTLTVDFARLSQKRS
jgi:hypothetical protein